VTRAADSLVVCERCDQAYRWIPLEAGAVARCTRCEAVLGRGHRIGIETVLALTVTALVLFFVVLFSHVISIRLGGTTVESTIPGAVMASWDEGDWLVAVATAVTALIAPAMYILLRLYVLVPIAAGRIPFGFGPCVRALHQVSRWNMLEVMTVGGLLSLVRLAALAEAAPGPAMFALGGLTILLAAIEAAGLRHLWWYVP
jgi:paraquat-inducible protein A